MKNRKITLFAVIIGIIAIITVIGFIFTACDEQTSGQDSSTKPIITINTHPAKTTNVNVGSISGSLSVSATVTQGATLSYQWYSNTTESNSGGTVINGETGSSYTIPKNLIAGTYYYYVEVKATAGAEAVRSNVATINVTVVGTPIITIYTQPAATTNVNEGSISGSINVSATVTQGATLSYQWYSNATASNSGGTVINGETGSSYTILKNLIAGTYYYYVEVRATGGALSVCSNVATVNVTVVDTPIITINIQPAETTNVNVGNISGSISVSATVTHGATLSYQWYSNTTASNSGGTVINGETGSSYTIPKNLIAGTYYYYVEVRATGGALSVRSDAATVNALPLLVEMVWINPGNFYMGSPITEANRSSDETQHLVTISNGFYIGKYEVTQEQYQTLTGVNPSIFSSDPASGEIQSRRPVENVTWYDAVEFCNKLSEREGLTRVYTITDRSPATGYPIISATVSINWNTNGYRLPTEAEWEYACRARTTTAYNNTGDTVNYNTGWFNSNSISQTHEVGKKLPNAWGLYDMHGNVGEWCSDGMRFYTSEQQTDPIGKYSGDTRPVRGGGWGWRSRGQDIRSAYRGGAPQSFYSDYLGFRLIRSENGNIHTHSYNSTWSSNETRHWKECECGDKIDVANHVPDNDASIVKMATITGTGIKELRCTICNKINTEIIPKIPFLAKVVSNKSKVISTNRNHNIVILANGDLAAWGENGSGQLGDGTTTNRLTPIQIGNGNDWESVSVNMSATLAIKTDGTLWGWGSTNGNSYPVQIGIDDDWEYISLGGGAYFAIKANGSLWAWGSNSNGALGNGLTSGTTYSPVQIGTDTDWESVASSSVGFSLAIKKNKTLWGWGTGGLIGDGTTTDRLTPTQIGNDTDWASVSAGTWHTVATKTNGSLWAWGSNSNLGNGLTSGTTYSPIQIGTATDWVLASAGDKHTVAIKSDGTLWAWGSNNSGQLGNGSSSTNNVTTPIKIGNDTDWASFSAGLNHTVATKTDGTIWSWGTNINVLGYGEYNLRQNTPRQIIIE